MSKNIYVGNLPYQYTEDALHALFQNEGKVSRTNLITDSYTGRSKGFGFVEMPDDAEAAAAIAKLNGMEIEGRKIVVNEARPKPEHTGARRSGGFGRNR